jgi:hypothetical protein
MVWSDGIERESLLTTHPNLRSPLSRSRNASWEARRQSLGRGDIYLTMSAELLSRASARVY